MNLYRVTIVYERTSEGYGSRKAVYESVAVMAPNEELARQRAASVRNWTDFTVATIAVDPCPSNYIYLRNGQVS